jgi:hypothetical protein
MWLRTASQLDYLSYFPPSRSACIRLAGRLMMPLLSLYMLRHGIYFNCCLSLLLLWRSYYPSSVSWWRKTSYHGWWWCGSHPIWRQAPKNGNDYENGYELSWSIINGPPARPNSKVIGQNRGSDFLCCMVFLTDSCVFHCEPTKEMLRWY